MAYAIQWATSADRALNKLPRTIRSRVLDAVTELAGNPRPRGTKGLKGSDAGRMRIRVGDYRVVYEVGDAELVVLVVRIGNRREIYR